MMARTTERPSVLLDAVVIVDVCKLGFWNAALSKLNVAVPAVIVSGADYFVGPEVWAELIGMPALVTAGDVESIEVSICATSAMLSRFTPALQKGLDAGEIEALALFHSGQLPDQLFCTADGQAIQALAMLGLSSCGISCEALFQRVGLTLPQHAPQKLREPFFQRHLHLGSVNRASGTGLAKPPCE